MHALEHIAFFSAGIVLWLPVLETLPAPEWFGTGAKLGYIVGVRLVATIVGNVFIWGGSPFYDTYRTGDDYLGLSPSADQSLAGSLMMLEGSIVTSRRDSVALPANGTGGRGAPGAHRAGPRPAAGAACRPLSPLGRAREDVGLMRGTGIHHLDLVVSSVERSLPFYRGLLEPLGYDRVGEVVGERGETIYYVAGGGVARRDPRGARPRRVRPLPRRRAPRRLRGRLARRRRRAAPLGRRSSPSRSRARRRSTSTPPATTRSSSTTRTGSSSRSSTCPTATPRDRLALGSAPRGGGARVRLHGRPLGAPGADPRREPRRRRLGRPHRLLCHRVRAPGRRERRAPRAGGRARLDLGLPPRRLPPLRPHPRQGGGRPLPGAAPEVGRAGEREVLRLLPGAGALRRLLLAAVRVHRARLELGLRRPRLDRRRRVGDRERRDDRGRPPARAVAS